MLTGREIEVLALVAEGKGDQEIGLLLYITANTVKGHMKSINRKLLARNRTHAVALAIRASLIA